MARSSGATPACGAVLVLFLAWLPCVPTPAAAGPVNPNISLIGQPFMRITGDPSVPDGKHARIDIGETEIAIDAYLNPYSSGYSTISITPNGLDLEEAYFTIFRGLPLGLNVKGGKYRVGFGKLNPAHPHTYPFADRFEVLEAYLPGDEALNETGVDISRMIPLFGDASVTVSADYLQGDTFRIARTPSGDPGDPILTAGGDQANGSRPAILGRASSFFMVGEQSGIEVGASAIRGTNNVAARARTTVLGGDFKAKLWRSARSYLVIQGEGLKLAREDAGWSAADGYATTTERPAGGYIFADYYPSPRLDGGVSCESFQEPRPGRGTANGVGAFAGWSVLEESLVFRVDWKRVDPADKDAFNTFTFRVLYSMGPHKAHQF